MEGGPSLHVLKYLCLRLQEVELLSARGPERALGLGCALAASGTQEFREACEGL